MRTERRKELAIEFGICLLIIVIGLAILLFPNWTEKEATMRVDRISPMLTFDVALPTMDRLLPVPTMDPVRTFDKFKGMRTPEDLT